MYKPHLPISKQRLHSQKDNNHKKVLLKTKLKMSLESFWWCQMWYVFYWSQQASYLLLTFSISLVTSLVGWSFVNPTPVPRQGWGCVLRHLWSRGAGRDHRAFHWSECSPLVREPFDLRQLLPHISTLSADAGKTAHRKGSTRFR